MPATTPPSTAAPAFDPEAIRADFPALDQTVYDDAPLVYLDNAATSQKPQVVIDRMNAYYARENSNVHRGVHALSQGASEAYEQARETLARFIHAPDPDTVVWTKGTTDGLNLIASSFGPTVVDEGDEILLTEMEHYSNIVPWQLLAERTGASIRVLPITDTGELRLDRLDDLLSEQTALVAISHVSNALGTVNPIDAIIDAAHAQGVPVVVDGAQSAPHRPVDVQAMDADFFVFSGHKMFGPTGIGVMYGKRKHLEAMPPYQGGGDMIDRVSFEGTTYDDIPHKFEAGTPNISGAIALGTAAEYILNVGRDEMHAYESDLLDYATRRLEAIEGLRLIGTAEEKTSVLSFVLDDVHPYDAGTFLDRLGIAVRTGNHCTEPLMDRLGLPGTIRASLAGYNTRADVDALVEGIRKTQDLFG